MRSKRTLLLIIVVILFGSVSLCAQENAKLFDVPMNIISLLQSNFDRVRGVVSKVMYSLIILEIIVIGIMMSTGAIKSGADIFARILKLTIVFVIVNNIEIFAGALLVGFRDIANSITAVDISKIFTDPMQMFREMQDILLDPIIDSVNKQIENTTSFWSIIRSGLRTLSSQVLGYVLMIVAYIFTLILILQLFIAKIEFTVVLFFAIILAPFMLFEKLKFLSDQLFSAIFGVALKVGMVYFFIALVFAQLQVAHESGQFLLFQDDGFTVWPVINLLVLILFLLYLAIYGPKITNTLLSGRPSLGASQLLQLAQQTSVIASSAKYLSRPIMKGIKQGAEGVARGYGAYTGGFMNTGKNLGGSKMGDMASSVGAGTKSAVSQMKSDFAGTPQSANPITQAYQEGLKGQEGSKRQEGSKGKKT